MLLPNPPVFQDFARGSLVLPVPLLWVWVPLPTVWGRSSLRDWTRLLPLGTRGEKQACSSVLPVHPVIRGSVGAKRCQGPWETGSTPVRGATGCCRSPGRDR